MTGGVGRRSNDPLGRVASSLRGRRWARRLLAGTAGAMLLAAVGVLGYPFALRAGAGHYPDTPLPCQSGNVAIAWHRTTYGRPFHNLDLMKPGDTIVLETPVGTCTYSVNKDPLVVAPTEFSVLDPTPTGTLTLTTCHPKNSAAQRLIVQADLQGPAAAA